MIEAPAYLEEHRRVKSLRALHLLDTPIEERFERITRMVCRLLDVPMAYFNLIDAERQHYKSTQGFTATDAKREAAICTHTLHEESIMHIPDLSKDPRFHDNPYVTGEWMNLSFYAGCPVRAPDGMPVGTLCAIDTKPRHLTDEQVEALLDLAAMVETELKAVSLSKAQSSLVAELGEAQRLAMVDPLTRLWNRAGILSLVDREWHECARHHKPVTFVMADVDYFKKINDTFGHAGGDTVLRGVAKRLLESLRSEDALGRVGGEEFLMILTDCHPDKVFETVDRIRQNVASMPIAEGEESYPVTLSLGAATTIPNEKMRAEELIKKADIALYRAKEDGRNRVVLD
jgi:diguanylate cyclase (GGDEF)-like protein